MVSCDAKKLWLGELESRMDALLGVQPKDPEANRSIESVAEALQAVVDYPCGESGQTPTAFGQAAPGVGEPGRDCAAATARYADSYFRSGERYMAAAPIAIENFRRACEMGRFGEYGQEAGQGSGQAAPGVEQTCDDAAKNFAATYDTSLRILTLMRDRHATPDLVRMVDEFAEQRQRAINDYRKRCMDMGGVPLEFTLPVAFGQATGAQVGGAVGGIAGGLVHPALAPLGAAAGAEVGRRVAGMFGAMAQYAATFSERDAATNLARTYQLHGVPSYVYFDPNLPKMRALTEEEREAVRAGRLAAPPSAGEPVPLAGQAREEREAAPLVAPRVPSGETGMWRVEIEPPATLERFQEVNRVRVISPTGQHVVGHAVERGGEIPSDPEHHLLLEFPVTTFGGMVDVDARPTALDAAVGEEYGGILVAGAEAKAPCDCVELPAGTRTRTGGAREETKLLCTRSGAIGLLNQTQVRENCSEYRMKADGRLAQVERLRDAQAFCGATVKGIEDPGERFAQRFSCLSEFLSSHA